MVAATARQRVDGRTTDMRDRLVATARQMFATQGFTATSLRDIAEQLQVTKAALYYHFPRKEQLIAAVLAPMADDIDAWFDEVEATRPPPRDALQSYFDVVHRHGDLLAAISREPAALQSGDLPQRVQGWLDRIQTVLTGPDATLEQRVRATVAIAGLARTTNQFPDAPVDRLRATAVDAALGALGPVGEAAPAGSIRPT